MYYPQPEPESPSGRGQCRGSICSDIRQHHGGIDLDKVLPLEIENDPGNGFFEDIGIT